MPSPMSNMEFATALRRLGWSHEEAARRVGRSVEDIKVWISGRRKLPIDISDFVKKMLSV